MKHIPNLFTLLNLFFGCLAIACMLQNGLEIRYTPAGESLGFDMSEHMWLGSIFIGCAALIDFLDGFVARLLKATSPLGKQLDSLADVVSFGVAPAMIFYQFLRLSFAAEENGHQISIVWIAPAFLYAMAAAYRLGKFNLDEQQALYFKGLPTPAAGLFVASLPMINWFCQTPWINSVLFNKWVLFACICLLSYLMICSLPLMALKFGKGNRKKMTPWIILLCISILASIILSWLAAPVILLCYIVLSVFYRNTFV